MTSERGTQDMERSCSLRPRTDQVAVARRFVCDTIADMGGDVDDRTRDDLALATSEAIANSVEHAGTSIELTVSRTDAGFVVSVHDDSSAEIEQPQLPAAADGPAHRGIGIIDALADHWGVENIEDDGKTLWFAIDTQRPVAAS
jgi:anti-sigma regulatory factor (Ser/Thr protein kinase)